VQHIDVFVAGSAEIEKIRAASTSWLASDLLRREIRLGSYVPGDKLPPQRELARSLGVSPVSLREALRILEAEGHLVLRRGATGGAVVVANAEPIDVQQQRLRLRIDEFEEWNEFRQAVEAAAAGLAAQRASADDIAALQQHIDSIVAADDVQLFRSADSAFHLRLAKAAGNQLLQQAVEDARAALFLAFDAVPHVVVARSTWQGHEQILAAVAAGDGRAAEAAMVAHVRLAWEEIRAIIEGHIPR
jgi:DNA-binding FadR family transcriptional regulator